MPRILIRGVFTIGIVVGFIVGVLMGRRNQDKVEQAVNEVKKDIDKAVAEIKKV